MRLKRWHFYFICIIIFVFQQVLERYFIIFKYYDELFAIILFVTQIRKYKVRKKANKLIALFIFLVISGLIGNIIASAHQKNIAIMQDILSNGKLFMIAIGAYGISLTQKEQKELGDAIQYFMRILFLIMFFCSIMNIFVDIGMTSNVRYGLNAFQFIYNNPAGLNTYYYLFIILYSITIYKSGKPRKNTLIYTIIGVVPWILTLRSRAFAFSAIYLVLFVYMVYYKNNKSLYKFKLYHLLLLAFSGLLISWDAVDTYFISNDRAARYQLLRKAFVLAKDFFPLGSGFGTYGTQASRDYYSQIYYQYKLSNYWGLSLEHPAFVTDQYWFAIIGQFGLIGCIIMICSLLLIFSSIGNIAKDSKSTQLAFITFAYTNIFASLTAASFIASTIIPSILIFYFLNPTGKLSDFSE